jgi:glutathione synthase/RimK-type ligase-like ATP-grasp enzyme
VPPTLDGVEDGLWALGSLAAGGIRTLNRAGALLAAHDKLLTARLLLRAGFRIPPGCCRPVDSSRSCGFPLW